MAKDCVCVVAIDVAHALLRALAARASGQALSKEVCVGRQTKGVHAVHSTQTGQHKVQTGRTNCSRVVLRCGCLHRPHGILCGLMQKWKVDRATMALACVYAQPLCSMRLASPGGRCVWTPTLL